MSEAAADDVEVEPASHKSPNHQGDASHANDSPTHDPLALADVEQKITEFFTAIQR